MNKLNELLEIEGSSYKDSNGAIWIVGLALLVAGLIVIKIFI